MIADMGSVNKVLQTRALCIMDNLVNSNITVNPGYFLIKGDLAKAENNLVSIIEHEEGNLQTMAVDILANIRNIQSMESILRYAKSHNNYLAKKALSKMNWGAYDYLDDFISSASSEERLMAINAAAIAGDSKRDIMYKALSDPDPRIREQAAQGFTSGNAIFGEEIIEALVTLLYDLDPGVREMAVMQLGLINHLPTKEEAETIVNVYKHDIKSAVKSKAASTIVRLSATYKDMIDVLLDDILHGSDEVRSVALHALDTKSGYKVIRALHARHSSYACQDYNRVLWIYAESGNEASARLLRQDYLVNRCDSRHLQLWAIGAINPEANKDIIIGSLKSESVKVRLQAIQLINEYFKSELDEYIVTMLGDEDQIVRRAAFNTLLSAKNENAYKKALKIIKEEGTDKEIVTELLAKHGYSEGIDYLIEKIKSDDLQERHYSRYLSNHKMDDKYLSLLIENLENPYPDVRASIINTLGNSRSRKVIFPLIGMINDPYPNNKIKATQSLFKITGVRMVPDYDQWMKWWKEYNSKKDQ